MNPIQFIFALIRMYLPLPVEFKTEVDKTYAEAHDAYAKITEKDETIRGKFKRFASNWEFKTLLLFLVIPVGRWLSELGKPKDDDDDFKEMMKMFKENK